MNGWKIKLIFKKLNNYQKKRDRNMKEIEKKNEYLCKNFYKNIYCDYALFKCNLKFKNFFFY